MKQMLCGILCDLKSDIRMLLMETAPDIAGKGIANPLAAIWSASQLLDFLGNRNGARPS